MSVSLIIPTLNASNEIRDLLDAVSSQSIKPDEIVVVDSSSEDDTVDIAAEYNVSVLTVQRANFDHGGTRHTAFERTRGEYVLFLTQDAIPATDKYIERIIEPFKDPKVAMVTGRQVPKLDAKEYVRLIQEFNYPDISSLRTKSDIERLGIKAFFASDTCSAYRRAAYEIVGGFPRPCNTNEDMLIASRFLRADYKVAYEANATVFHSHNFSLRDQYVRNRAIGTFLAQNKSELDVPSEVSSGVDLFRYVMNRLAEEHKPKEMIAFSFDCFARLLGNRVGRYIGQHRG